MQGAGLPWTRARAAGTRPVGRASRPRIWSPSSATCEPWAVTGLHGLRCPFVYRNATSAGELQASFLITRVKKCFISCETLDRYLFLWLLGLEPVLSCLGCFSQTPENLSRGWETALGGQLPFRPDPQSPPHTPPPPPPGAEAGAALKQVPEGGEATGLPVTQPGSGNFGERSQEAKLVHASVPAHLPSACLLQGPEPPLGEEVQSVTNRVIFITAVSAGGRRVARGRGQMSSHSRSLSKLGLASPRPAAWSWSQSRGSPAHGDPGPHLLAHLLPATLPSRSGHRGHPQSFLAFCFLPALCVWGWSGKGWVRVGSGTIIPR